MNRSIPMSEEQLKAFLAKVHVDPILQAQLNEAKCPDDVVSFAKEHGYELTAEKVTELRDAELEGVAGGSDGIFWCVPYTKRCFN